ASGATGSGVCKQRYRLTVPEAAHIFAQERHVVQPVSLNVGTYSGTRRRSPKFILSLTRISHTKESASGRRISESCFARTTFGRFEERPRCKHSVARNCWHLHLSAAAKLWAVLMAERSRQTPELCCCGRRIERSGWSNALASASSIIATRS